MPTVQTETCSDCGATYEAGQPHEQSCDAHICGLCGNWYPKVLYADLDGLRMCDSCTGLDGE
jgi:hypothetical protein